MATLHKIELYVIELNDSYGSGVILNKIDNALNNVAMTSCVRGFNIKSAKLDWNDNHPLNFNNSTQEEHDKYLETHINGKRR